MVWYDISTMQNQFLVFNINSIHINATFLWFAFLLFFVAYSVLSGILQYHWTEYGMGTRAVHIAQIVFFGVSLFFFLMGIAAISLF